MTSTTARLCDRCHRPFDGASWIESGLTCEACSRRTNRSDGAKPQLRERDPEVQPGTELTDVDLAALLDEVTAFVRRFVVLSEAQASAVVLWAAHTYAFDASDNTPYLHITSPEAQCGKSRLLEVLDLLVAKPWLTSGVTAAVLVRKVAKQEPTLLLDETDAAFGGNPEYGEALRGVLNSGHRRGGVVSLCVKSGGDFELKDFPTYCPKVLSGIGILPPTVADRSIRIDMKRKRKGEAERLKRPRANRDAAPLREGLAAWGRANLDALREAEPYVPEAISDRAEDGWTPLLSIADLAGGSWPPRARDSALALSAGSDEESPGIKLLANIRTVYEEHGGPDRILSAVLVQALVAREDWDWADVGKNRPLTANMLARKLRLFGIEPKKQREGDTTTRGYVRGDFEDVWGRYVPSHAYPVQPPQPPQAPQERLPESNLGGESVADVPVVAVAGGVREEDVEPALGCDHCTAEEVEERWKRAEAQDAEVATCECCKGPTAQGRVRCRKCEEAPI